MSEGPSHLGRRRLVSGVGRVLRRWTRRPAVGRLDLGDLRRLKPVSNAWGSDRGLPIDRYYIAEFLTEHAADIGGHVLEIGGNSYAMAFGGARVERSDVLHVAAGQPGTTIKADLTNAPEIASDTFDCILCTQTLQFIPDTRAAVATLRRILKPGGVLLATVPTLSRLDFAKSNQADDYWRFTRAAAAWLFEAVFGKDRVSIAYYGNVLAATGFLYGLAAEELSTEELRFRDPRFEMLVAVRATKAAGGP